MQESEDKTTSERVQTPIFFKRATLQALDKQAWCEGIFRGRSIIVRRAVTEYLEKHGSNDENPNERQGGESMKSEDTSLHHVPSVQGMHQATNVTSDAWEVFFSACLEKYDELLLRRQVKQQGETHKSDEPKAEAASLLLCGATEGATHD